MTIKTKPKRNHKKPALSRIPKNLLREKNKEIIILAIETSCDETAAAVLRVDLSSTFPHTETLSSVVKSQIQLHKHMGGVVPEVAARAHLKRMRPVVEKAVADSGLRLDDIDYIAPTVGPGLIPSLIVGVEFAKGLAFAAGRKMIPVNHMLGHLYSPFGSSNSQFKTLNPKLIFPQIALIVSGGHTILVLMENEKKYRVLGQTVDDAAGEAFDKVAKLLKLPYPGGPEVSKLAEKADAPVEFPRPMMSSKNYNFSFAGLKTAVLYHVRNLNPQHSILSPMAKANTCAGFQNAAVDVLVTKTMRAVTEFKARSVSLSGGVSANKLLRESLTAHCQSAKVECHIPPFRLCTDNAEMIGIAAAFKLHQGFKPVNYRKIKADSNLSL